MDRDLAALHLLAALHALGGSPLAREEGRLLLPPDLSPEALEALRPHKARLLRALEDGEEVPAPTLLEDPRRLALLLLPEGAEEERVSLAVYREGEAHRYLAPPGHLAPFLLWSARHEPAPRRVWVGGAGWSLDLEPGAGMAGIETGPPLNHVVVATAAILRPYLTSLREGTRLREVGLWRGALVRTMSVEEALEALRGRWAA